MKNSMNYAPYHLFANIYHNHKNKNQLDHHHLNHLSSHQWSRIRLPRKWSRWRDPHWCPPFRHQHHHHHRHAIFNITIIIEIITKIFIKTTFSETVVDDANWQLNDEGGTLIITAAATQFQRWWWWWWWWWWWRWWCWWWWWWR